jgi:hypothetical protein
MWPCRISGTAISLFCVQENNNGMGRKPSRQFPGPLPARRRHHLYRAWHATQEDADNRAADVEPDHRRRRFVDPRLVETTIDEWIRSWSEAHRVADITWATYDSHIRNHILPRWSGVALGDIARIAVKGWVNKTLRPTMADKSGQDIPVLFSMILSEAVDEGLPAPVLAGRPGGGRDEGLVALHRGAALS